MDLCLARIGMIMVLSLSLQTSAIAAGEYSTFRDWAEKVFLAREKPAVVGPGLEVRRQDHGRLNLGLSVMNTPLQIGDMKFTHGLGTHSVSEIAVRLPGPARKFSAQIGIDNNYDTQGKHGSVVFAVEAGGKEVFRSSLCRGGDAPVQVSLDVPSLTALVLRVLDGGDGESWDQSDWAEAKVQLEDGRVLFLDELAVDGDCAGLSEKIPFSFVVGERTSGEILSVCKREVAERKTVNGRQCSVITYTDSASSLEVRCELMRFPDYQAVEWVLFLKNTGTADTALIKDVRPLDLSIGVPGRDVVLHHASGSSCSPADFLPVDEVVAKPKGQVNLSARGGRSSDGALPFFNLEWGNGGLVGAIGWSGQWAMQLQRSDEKNLRIIAGQQASNFKLRPGEEVRTPRILLVSWDGNDYMRGNNLLRRLILEQYVPRVDGKLAIPPLTANTWFAFNEGNNVNEENQKAVMPYMVKAGVEAYWMDAGWFEGGWPNGAGSWVPKKVAFPNGLKPVGDEAHRLGLKFVLWFEPERVTKISLVAREHPEWVMHRRNEGGADGLFNMGDPAACKWMTDYLSKCISDWGIDVLRIDFNIEPLSFWQAGDSADRQGISEIRYIEGLYTMWDGLLKKHPGLTIDDCASGGRRIDLETMSRSYPLWQSDTQCCGKPMPVQDQVQNLGLSMYVPLHAGGVWAFDPYNFRSIATTGCSICPDLSRDASMAEAARKMFDEVKMLRPFYLGDYYPLLAITRSEADWCGWQYDRPDLGGGFFALFRRAESPYSVATICMHALVQDATYELKDVDSGKVSEKTGKELASGVDLEIKTKSSCVLVRYQQK